MVKKPYQNNIDKHLDETVLRTMNFLPNKKDNIGHAVMGLSGETGEVTDMIKKHLFYGKELDVNKLKNEIGDVLYYIQFLTYIIDSSVEECLQINTDKLQKRYPNGFSLEDSIAKKDELV